jgi:GNAT superfamily N-acetyltransferase
VLTETNRQREAEAEREEAATLDRCERVDLPHEAADAFGWRAIIAEQGVREADFAVIVDEMRGEKCVHSWLDFTKTEAPIAKLVEALIDWELRKRPTIFFRYFGAHADGTRELIGVGTVAKRVRNDFPYDGFPVVARCYLRRPFRGHGIYASLLRHRYYFCQQHWRERLKAIHLGSTNRRVLETVTDAAIVSPPFRRVCTELLTVKGETHVVNDFLAFQPAYEGRLRKAAEALAASSTSARLAESLCDLLDGGDRYDVFHVRDLWSDAVAKDSALAKAHGADLDGLAAFCRVFTPPLRGAET